MKLIQPPYSIFGFRNCFCLLQSEQNFVKSSHFWASLHSVHLTKKTKQKQNGFNQIVRNKYAGA